MLPQLDTVMGREREVEVKEEEVGKVEWIYKSVCTEATCKLFNSHPITSLLYYGYTYEIITMETPGVTIPSPLLWHRCACDSGTTDEQ